MAVPASADIRLQATNPLAGGQWHHDFEGIPSSGNRLAFAIALGVGTGEEIAVAVSAQQDTEILLACETQPACTDHSIRAWTNIRPDLGPESGTVLLSFQPAVPVFAIRVDRCDFSATPMVGATARAGASELTLPLESCVPGQWIVVEGVNGAPLEEIVLRGNASSSIAFDDLHVGFAGAPPSSGPDLATVPQTTSSHSNTQQTLDVPVLNLTSVVAPLTRLRLLLPIDLIGRTDPVDDGGGRISLDLGTLPAESTTMQSILVTPPTMDCHSVITTIALARGPGVETDASNNFSAQVLVQDPADRLPQEDCSGARGDADCDGKYGCVDEDCRGTPRCRQFYTPQIVWGGDPIWDFWPPLVPPFLPGQPQGPELPYEFPDPYDLPPPPEDCFVYAHGEPQRRPRFCCDPPPPFDSPHAASYAATCAPLDPNLIESSPAVSGAGIGWIAAGDPIDFTVHYENIGTVDAHGVGIVLVLPPELDETTLVVADGGHFDAASRVITWIDPVVFPSDPRVVHYSAKVRASAPVGTKVRSTATVIFPDAFPPTRIDTNTITHVIPDPRADFSPALFVSHCVPTDLPGVYRVQVQNRGLANAYNLRATLVDPPSDLGVVDGEAVFGDPAATLPAAAILSTTTSFDTVQLDHATPGVDPCLALEWRLDYETFRDGAQQVKVTTVVEPGGCGCQVGGHRRPGGLWVVLLGLGVLVRRRRR